MSESLSDLARFNWQFWISRRTHRNPRRSTINENLSNACTARRYLDMATDRSRSNTVATSDNSLRDNAKLRAEIIIEIRNRRIIKYAIPFRRRIPIIRITKLSRRIKRFSFFFFFFLSIFEDRETELTERRIGINFS